MDRLFPKVADNTYTGHPIARWVFIFIRNYAAETTCFSGWSLTTVVTIIRSLIHMFADEVFASREAARTAIFHYVMGFYNRHRRHSALGYQTPQSYTA